MAAEDLFRAKASRPEYRRAGLVLGSTAWVEFTLGQVGEGGMTRLAGDQVISLQIQDGDAWVAMPAELRARWAALGSDLGDDEHAQSAEDLLAEIRTVWMPIADHRDQVAIAYGELRLEFDDLAGALAGKDARLVDADRELEAVAASASCWRKLAEDLTTVEGLALPEAWLTSLAKLRQLDPPGDQATKDTPPKSDEATKGAGDAAAPAKVATGVKTSGKAKEPAKPD